MELRQEKPESKIRGRRGVVLLATLVSLILLTGLALGIQAASIATSKAWGKLRQTHHEDMALQAIRELARPIVGEAIVHYDVLNPIPLNGKPIAVEYLGVTFEIALQDVDGTMDFFRSSDEDWGQFLADDWRTTMVKPQDSKNFVSLNQALAAAQVPLSNLIDARRFMALRRNSAQVNVGTLNIELTDASGQSALSEAVQPNAVILSFK